MNESGPPPSAQKPGKVTKSTISRILDMVPAGRLVVHSRVFQRTVNQYLQLFPIIRTLKTSGIRYFIKDLENFYTAEEIFSREVYNDAFTERVSSFVDLGANCGYFACYAAHRGKLRGEKVIGLTVEANPTLLSQIQGNLDINNLAEVHSIHGLVGRLDKEEFGELLLSNSHTSSSQFGVHPHAKWKKFGQATQVAYVSVKKLWTEKFGDRKIDLLKVDIEGSEERFLNEAPSVLPLCHRVLIEIHKWLVDREKIIAILDEHGFAYDQSIENDEWFEVVLFVRKESVQ